MKKLTSEKYECSHCSNLTYLVIVRGRAWLCKECYNKMLAERRAKRNKLVKKKC